MYTHLTGDERDLLARWHSQGYSARWMARQVKRSHATIIRELRRNRSLVSGQYVAIAAYFDAENLPRLAAFFYKQAEEEREHAMKFVRYLVDAGAGVAIPQVAAPTRSFATAEAAVRLSLDSEMDVTRRIHALVDLAGADKDHTTRNFLEWFVEEQLEEVSSMDRLLSLVRRAGEANLLLVEQQLGGKD